MSDVVGKIFGNIELQKMMSIGFTRQQAERIIAENNSRAKENRKPMKILTTFTGSGGEEESGDSGNEPPVSGYSVWLDAELGSFTPSSPTEGQAISQWDDLSDNENHFTQGAAVNQPTYTASGVNSGPSIVFTGSLFMSATDQNLGDEPFTAFTVAIYDATSDPYFLRRSGNMYVGTSNNEARVATGGSSGQTVDTVTTMTAGNAYLVTAQYANNSKVKIGIDGETLVESGANLEGYDNSVANPFNIGDSSSTSGFEGKVACVLIYNSELSQTDIDSVEDYLKDRFGIT